VLVMGTLIFVIEGPEHGFTSVPMGIYWAISTVTTVGYGDVTPATPMGRFFASVMMLLGWGIVAVPTGIVGAEISRNGTKARMKSVECDTCGENRHEDDARFCRRCGTRLQSTQLARSNSGAPSEGRPAATVPSPSRAPPSTEG